MARRVSSAWIGAFVLGGIGLVVGGIVAFGSGLIFDDSIRRAAVFGESLQGLHVGAPVTYNGVQVGEVTQVGAVLTVEAGTIVNGVVFRLHGGALVVDRDYGDTAFIVDRLIDDGLRAQIGVQSVVTGSMNLRLVFAAEEPPYEAPSTFMGVPTMPAVRSDLARFTEIAQTLGQDLPDMVGRFGSIADEAGKLFTEDNLANVSAALASAASFAAALEAAGPGVTEAVASLRDAATTIGETAARLDGLLGDRTEDVTAVIDGLATAVAAMGSAAEEVQALVRENRGALRQFTGEGLGELQGLAVDAQSMVRAIERVARRLEAEGAGFLLRPEAIPEYQPRSRGPR